MYMYIILLKRLINIKYFLQDLPKLLKYLPKALAYNAPRSESGESPPTLFSTLYSLSP